ncbi:MAG: lysostaphin resistance A-like protein, partial [Pseudobdellovibrionaceae bacterium]
DLMMAPFHFSHLLKPTTFIPLGVLAYAIGSSRGEYKKRPLNSSDGFFAGGISYNAGVGEEALFRGYLMMNLRESWGSDFWSNAATATVFGLAHLSPSNRAPVAQLALGYYLGWITQRNDWTLSESIFLHAWWDVLAIAAALEYDEESVVYLPAFVTTF